MTGTLTYTWGNTMEQYKKIDYRTAVDFLLPRHYSGRVPVISYAYGLYNEGELMAVCTFEIHYY